MGSLKIKKINNIKISKNSFETIRYIIITFLGMAFSLNNVILNIYPLSISFLSSLSGVSYIYGLLGSIVGIFFVGDILLVSKYMSIVLIFTASKYVLSNIISLKSKYSIGVISIIISITISEFSKFLYLPITNYIITSLVTEVFLSILFCYIFVNCSNIFKFKFKYNVKNIILLNSIIAIALNSLDDIFRFKFSISIIFISYLILIFNYMLKELNYITFCGVYVFLITLLFPTRIYIVGAIMFYSIICTYTNRYNKTIKMLTFFTMCVISFTPFFSTDNFFYILEPLCGGILFIITPAIKGNYKNMLYGKKDKCNNVNEFLNDQLSVMAYSLETISYDINIFNERVNMISVNDISSVYTKTMEEVCKKCKKKVECSTTYYNQLFDCFNSLGKKLIYENDLTLKSSHYFLRDNCINATELITKLKENYNTYLEIRNNSKNINVYKENSVKQFSFIGNAVRNIGKNLYDIDYLDLEVGEDIINFFTENNIKCESSYVVVEKSGLYTVTVNLLYRDINKKDMRFISDSISKIIKRDLDMPIINAINDTVNLVFLQKANINVNSYIYQNAKIDNDINGDTAGVFKDISGNTNVILCDGMGSGEKAHIESNITMNMMQKLIKTGIRKNNSLDIVNSALLFKNSEECFSTIDLASINTFTGRTDVYKAGGVSTFVKKGSDVITINSPSMPVGILCNVSYSKNKLVLQNKDILVMVSDGVLTTGEDWVESIIGNYNGKSPKELAIIIGENAKMRNSGLKADDVSVIVCYIENVV